MGQKRLRWLLLGLIVVCIGVAVSAAFVQRSPRLPFPQGLKPAKVWKVGEYEIREYYVSAGARELVDETEKHLGRGWIRTQWSTGKNPAVPYAAAFHGPNPRNSVTIEDVSRQRLIGRTKVVVFHEVSYGAKIQRRLLGQLGQ